MSMAISLLAYKVLHKSSVKADCRVEEAEGKDPLTNTNDCFLVSFLLLAILLLAFRAIYLWFMISLTNDWPKNFENAALFLRFVPPSTLICHESATFRKRSSNQKNLKTAALQIVLKNSFCMWSSLKVMTPDNHVIFNSVIEFSPNTNSNANW